MKNESSKLTTPTEALATPVKTESGSTSLTRHDSLDNNKKTS
jgi:hypothetical protein